ncbi:hypothetical protein PHMEG_00015359 [Phytophthora megakarya]|uniref:Eukaryotic/viral aspartic protease n=1 Tax=Phytophthora megakarya TaxID=4795 RepID=A0A225W2I2_9STRA|nr:hypothetical protein PHMEG_00015359 [Phytophthora megakarya]
MTNDKYLPEQPPAVERKENTTSARILAKPSEVSVAPRKLMLGHPGSDDRGDGLNYRYSRSLGYCRARRKIGEKPDTRPTKFSDAGDDEIGPAEDSVDMELTYISVMQ